MSKTRFIAINEHGKVYHIGANPPRKWLLNYFGRQHADKIYDDLKGKHHVGYVIAGVWLTIYRINDWKSVD